MTMITLLQQQQLKQFAVCNSRTIRRPKVTSSIIITKTTTRRINYDQHQHVRNVTLSSAAISTSSLFNSPLSSSTSTASLSTWLHTNQQQLRQQQQQRRQSSSVSSGNSNSNDSNSTSATSSNDTELTTILPIDFDIAAKIIGQESQILTVQIENQQLLRTESGSLLYMTDHIQMNTTLSGKGGGSSNSNVVSSSISRLMTGQNLFITDYTYTGPQHTSGTIALGTNFPSKIIRINYMDYNINKLICQKGALLCASHTIDIQMEFTKSFTTGFFGGEGFILQGLIGSGDVFVKAGGTLIKRELRSNETLRISSGCLVCFTEGIDYDVQMVQGISNIIGSGEGLFITTLTGPGTVWLQGQPPDRMIGEIARRVPSGGGGLGFVVPVGGSSSSGGGGGSSS